MKLKLSQLIEASPALFRIGSEKCSGKMAYNISRNIRVIDPELKEYDKARVALIENKYGETQDGGEITVPQAKVKSFLKELEELQAEEIELDIRKIMIPEDFPIAPLDLYLLDWMLEET